MKLVTIVTVLAMSVALQGCMATKVKIVEMTADCSSWTVYRTSKVRKSTQGAADEVKSGSIDKKIGAMATCAAYPIDGYLELRAEGARLNQLAADDRNAGITTWGNGEHCEKYEAYSQFQLKKVDWRTSAQESWELLTDDQKKCIATSLADEQPDKADAT